MMKLEVLASGSDGNCYLLHTSCGVIIIEAGIPWNDVLKALHFDVTSVLCCLISHEHGDHAKYIKEYVQNMSMIIMTHGTKKALNFKSPCVSTWEYNHLWEIGISMFSTQHDAEEPCGFYIKDINTGEALIFATDTYYIKYRFANVNYIMVECNYAEDILQENIEKGEVHPARAKRLSESHFELSHVKDFINANNSLNLSNVILLHLSKQNSDPKRFKEEIDKVTLAQVDIARKGLMIDLGGIAGV